MAKARKKPNKLSAQEAISEMIEWEDKGETEHPRYRIIQKLFPGVQTKNYRK